MEKRHILQSALSATIILGISTALFLYTAGFRISKKSDSTIDITRTGIVGAKSIPEAASVYLDDKLTTATNDTVSGLTPGIHTLKIVKKGFVEWKKDVEVFPELVTDITAVLVSQTPRLEPLTNTGAKYPSISPTLSKLAYFSADGETPGVWVIPFGNSGLSLFRATPSVVLKDSRYTKYSSGVSIEWSPDEKKLLVEGESKTFYIVDLETNTAQSTSTPETIRKEWDQALIQKRTDFVEKLDVPSEIKEKAIAMDSSWSPDEKKVLYTVKSNGINEYRVYNMEKPIPVGEKVETVVFTTNASDPQPKVSWYSDSFHLILTQITNVQENKGSIKLIRIDGTNETEVYNNTLFSDMVFSAPGGDKMIILTSFKSGERTDLYTIGIR
ncbi:MAG: PEGA domain-containing protein [Patescibacteria group bacterium]|jgi:hypothetical protein